jgi:hypothetical protein
VLEILPAGALTEGPNLEPHHIRRLADGGPDHPRWVAALCPTCHRRVHHGVDGKRDLAPPWAPKFWYAHDLWRRHQDAYRAMREALQPLRGKHLVDAALVYPGTEEAWGDAASLADSSGIPPGCAVDPPTPTLSE